MCEITIRPGSPISSGQLCITGKCQSPINLLKFFDQWYDGETVMQLHYGPVGVYFTGQDENGMWMSITDDEAKRNTARAPENCATSMETYGPKLILAEYYRDVFHGTQRHQSPYLAAGGLDALCEGHKRLSGRLHLHQHGNGDSGLA